MAPSAPNTELLLAGRQGERAALDEFLPLVYRELRCFGLSEDTVLRDRRLATGRLLRELTRSHAG